MLNFDSSGDVFSTICILLLPAKNCCIERALFSVKHCILKSVSRMTSVLGEHVEQWRPALESTLYGNLFLHGNKGEARLDLSMCPIKSRQYFKTPLP